MSKYYLMSELQAACSCLRISHLILPDNGEGAVLRVVARPCGPIGDDDGWVGFSHVELLSFKS